MGKLISAFAVAAVGRRVGRAGAGGDRDSQGTDCRPGVLPQRQGDQHRQRSQDAGGHQGLRGWLREGGRPMALLTSDGKVYTLGGDLAANNNAKIIPHISHTVEVTGDVTQKDGKATIAAAAMKMISSTAGSFFALAAGPPPRREPTSFTGLGTTPGALPAGTARRLGMTAFLHWRRGPTPAR